MSQIIQTRSTEGETLDLVDTKIYRNKKFVGILLQSTSGLRCNLSIAELIIFSSEHLICVLAQI